MEYKVFRQAAVGNFNSKVPASRVSATLVLLL